MKTTLADALERRGYTQLTPVQEAVSHSDVEGRDLLVSAQTGSGKTVGFGLAIASRILGDDDRFGAAAAPLALVIAPTRELALQVRRELQWLYEGAGATVASTVGGMDMRDERRALERGAHIVVATPGRLRDHIMRGSIDLSGLRAVVLDEADEMLDLGFREDLEFILENAPAERQTLLFSATVPAAIARLAQTYQSDAVRIEKAGGSGQHADIDYRALRVAARDGENAIINVLRYYEAPNAIVFCNTRAMVNRLTTRLSNRGFSVVALSGELSQTERTHALQAMRDGRARVCVATDVAARGIDLPNLDLVVHAELPTNQETLLHRSGRTGRAGRRGVSAMIVPPASRKKAERLLGWAKLNADWDDAPGAEAVAERDEERMLGDPDWHLPVPESDSRIVGLLTENFTPEQVAAAYIRLYHERHSAPEDLSEPTETRAPRQAFGPSVWLSVAGGRATGAEPRRILPMICKAGGITRDEIGAIRIQPEESLVEIRASALPGFLKTIGSSMTLDDGSAVSELDAPPRMDAPRGPTPRKDAPARRAPQGGSDHAPAQPEPDRPAAGAPVAVAPTEHAETGATPASSNAGTTTPVDWNDAPAPRQKKPKPASKGGPRTSPDRAEKRAPPRTSGPARPRPARDDDPSARGRGNGDPARERSGKPSYVKPGAKPERKWGASAGKPGPYRADRAQGGHPAAGDPDTRQASRPGPRHGSKSPPNAGRGPGAGPRHKARPDAGQTMAAKPSRGNASDPSANLGGRPRHKAGSKTGAAGNPKSGGKPMTLSGRSFASKAGGRPGAKPYGKSGGRPAGATSGPNTRKPGGNRGPKRD